MHPPPLRACTWGLVGCKPAAPGLQKSRWQHFCAGLQRSQRFPFPHLVLAEVDSPLSVEASWEGTNNCCRSVSELSGVSVNPICHLYFYLPQEAITACWDLMHRLLTCCAYTKAPNEVL